MGGFRKKMHSILSLGVYLLSLRQKCRFCMYCQERNIKRNFCADFCPSPNFSTNAVRNFCHLGLNIMYTSSVHSYHYVHIFVLDHYNIGHAKHCTLYKALCKPLVLTACAKGSGAAIWHLYASNLYSNSLVPDFHACLHSTCTMFMLDNDIYFLVFTGRKLKMSLKHKNHWPLQTCTGKMKN